MNIDLNTYNHIRSGRAGFYEKRRGLVAVWGSEAVQFLDGLITNDVNALEDGVQILAAFPNAQGRLLAVVRVLRQGDRFLIETEEATHEKIFNNLFRFTFAGDFFVEDLSADYSYFEIFGPQKDVFNPDVADKFAGSLTYKHPYGAGYFVPTEIPDMFRSFLADENGIVEIDDELYETLRIEAGIPKYGLDMDEATVVPELGLDGMISYTKGCYIGQEIIARIHFRGHVAKQLTGLVFEGGYERTAFDAGEPPALQSADGKNAGRITSVTYSPKLEKHVALAYVRYDFLGEGTELLFDEQNASVKSLPFL